MFEAIITATKNLENARANRIARIENALLEANSNIPPKIDRNGRFHAPIDGYVCENAHGVEGVYARGEFLPVTDDEESGIYSLGTDFLGGCKTRVKAKVSDIDQLCAFLSESKVEELEVSKGAAWDMDGEKVAYAYLSGKKCLISAASRCIEIAPKPAIKEPEVYMEEGRHTVTARVHSIKFVEGMYGVTCKMFIRTDEGHKIYGTVPASIYDEVEVGKVVTFSAKFERGTDGMSYYTRPTKASVIEA